MRLALVLWWFGRWYLKIRKIMLKLISAILDNRSRYKIVSILITKLDFVKETAHPKTRTQYTQAYRTWYLHRIRFSSGDACIRDGQKCKPLRDYTTTGSIDIILPDGFTLALLACCTVLIWAIYIHTYTATILCMCALALYIYMHVVLLALVSLSHKGRGNSFSLLQFVCLLFYCSQFSVRFHPVV